MESKNLKLTDDTYRIGDVSKYVIQSLSKIPNDLSSNEEFKYYVLAQKTKLNPIVNFPYLNELQALKRV